MANLKIIVVDDNPMLRIAVKKMLGRLPDFRVVDEADKGTDLLSKLAETSCDILWMDPRLNDVDEFDLLSKIKKDYPKLKVLIYTANYDNKTIGRLVGMNVEGILLKDDFFSIIPLAMRTIRDGGTYYSERINH